MNSLYAFDYAYQGMTFDERMALRQLFLSDDDLPLPTEQAVVGAAFSEDTRQ